MNAWRDLCLCAVLLCANAGAAPNPAADPDPLRSGHWGEMQKQHLGGGTVVFDDARVKVQAPAKAEDSMNVPVAVRVEGLPEVKRVVVVADFNPITKVLEFEPLLGKPEISFRIKLQQATPVRAAAQTADGVWHVGGMWVDSAGGGCTLPSAGRVKGNWSETLGQVSARAWQQPQATRVRVRIMHPMDTGLAPGIPAFYIENLAVRDESGKEYLRLRLFEPVSENPVFSFDLPPGVAPQGALRLTGADNNGNRIEARLP